MRPSHPTAPPWAGHRHLPGRREAAMNDSDLTGITGFFADLIAALGEIGVGVLTFIETVIPPCPARSCFRWPASLPSKGACPWSGYSSCPPPARCWAHGSSTPSAPRWD